MATPRPSFTKRQREMAKRERQQMKAAKRAARKNGEGPAVEDDLDLDLEQTPEAPPEESLPQ